MNFSVAARIAPLSPLPGNTGQTVAIHADGVSGAIDGRLVDIAPRAEFTPRAALTERERADLVFAIKVSYDDPGGRLKAGLPVTLEVPLTP